MTGSRAGFAMASQPPADGLRGGYSRGPCECGLGDTSNDYGPRSHRDRLPLAAHPAAISSQSTLGSVRPQSDSQGIEASLDHRAVAVVFYCPARCLAELQEARGAAERIAATISHALVRMGRSGLST